MTKKLNITDLKSICVKNDCALLDTVYVNARTPMRFVCKCGNISVVCWDSFRKNMRCRPCGTISGHNKQKHNYEYVKKLFESNGCKLLESTYDNAKTLMKYMCACGNESQIRFSDFNRGMRCRTCYIKRTSGNKHHMWHKDREQYNEEKSIKKRCYSMLSHMLKTMCKNKKARTEVLLGYDFESLISHITSHPNWTKIKQGVWHIDHIFPISAFFDHNIYNIKLINALDNLQPLSAQDNLTKSWKYDKTKFITWLNKHNVTLHPQ